MACSGCTFKVGPTDTNTRNIIVHADLITRRKILSIAKWRRHFASGDQHVDNNNAHTSTLKIHTFESSVCVCVCVESCCPRELSQRMHTCAWCSGIAPEQSRNRLIGADPNAGLHPTKASRTHRTHKRLRASAYAST